MNCIIIEDQPPAQRILKKYIEDIGSLHLTGVFSNAIPAMEFLKTESVDLIFLDIHLPKLSGIDFLKTISNQPHVILTTAFPDYALESYELNVVDYLLKPFSFQRFMKAVEKIPAQGQEKEYSESFPIEQPVRKEIFIKSGYELIRVIIEEINYIKSDADYTELYTTQKKYLTSEPLHYWLETLDQGQFARIHKSYIINTSKIDKISGNQVYLIDKTIIPIGRTYKDDFLNRYVK